MKRYLLCVLGLAAMIMTAGCGKKDEGGNAATDQQGKLTIAVIPKSTANEFWETVQAGAMTAAEELGVDVKWEGTVTETEIAEQNKIIENMVNLGVDGMALAPLNKRAMEKQVRNAVNAGIPVVVFDSAVEGDAHSSFVATDNHKGGALGAEHMIELLGDNGGKVMVMRFVQGTGSTEARAAGFMETAEAAGIDIVADPYPDTGTIEGAKTVAVNTFEGFIEDGELELDGVFACNLVASLGVASALDDLRKSGVDVDVKFVGFDTSKKLVDELQAGTIDALVAQNPRRMGYLAVQTIVKVVRGEPVPDVVDTGVKLVTREKLENDPEIRKLVGLE
ncbi:MAG: substrate-binding domain-containing protein [Candidatus Pacebacteria bacterium]|nr:substrate-binding domain-containing protein [Candidatus Paceibacterota bacterium]